MDVALDGPEHDPAQDLPLHAPPLHLRLEHRRGRLHRLARHHEVGQEKVSSSEALADLVQARNESPLNRVERGQRDRERLGRERGGPIGVALEDAAAHRIEEFVMHGILLAPARRPYARRRAR